MEQREKWRQNLKDQRKLEKLEKEKQDKLDKDKSPSPTRTRVSVRGAPRCYEEPAQAEDHKDDHDARIEQPEALTSPPTTVCLLDSASHDQEDEDETQCEEEPSPEKPVRLYVPRKLDQWKTDPTVSARNSMRHKEVLAISYQHSLACAGMVAMYPSPTSEAFIRQTTAIKDGPFCWLQLPGQYIRGIRPNCFSIALSGASKSALVTTCRSRCLRWGTDLSKPKRFIGSQDEQGSDLRLSRDHISLE